MMAILSFLKRAGKQLGSDISGGMELLSTVFARPLQTSTALLRGDKKQILTLVGETKKETAGKTIKKTLITTGLVSAGILTRGAGLIPKTFGGKLLAVGVGSAVLSSPKTAKLLEPTSLVEKSVKGGVILGETIEGRKTPDIKTALKTGGILGAGAVLGAGIVAVAKRTKEKAIEIKEKAIEGDPIITTETPILPETTQITPTRAVSKRRRTQKMPSVRQSVRVNILNRPITSGIRISNKRYINERLFN